jgi:hypothetical protein
MYITMYIYVIYILKKVLNQILCCTCSPAEQTELLALLEASMLTITPSMWFKGIGVRVMVFNATFNDQ